MIASADFEPLDRETDWWRRAHPDKGSNERPKTERAHAAIKPLLRIGVDSVTEKLDFGIHPERLIPESKIVRNAICSLSEGLVVASIRAFHGNCWRKATGCAGEIETDDS